MSKRIIHYVIAVLAMALGTWLIAWWTVPLVGAALGYIDRGDRIVALRAALAGVTAWVILLAVQAPFSDLRGLAAIVGDVLGVGGGALIALTLAYPALLAASAASLARSVSART